jgi:hypothetical protein
MVSHTPTNGLNIVAIVGVGILAWYLYQIGSRKKTQIRYKLRRAVVGLAVYLPCAVIVTRQGLAPLEAVVLSMLAGMGCAWLLVNPPKRERRISKSIRQEVIARDLTSKGLKWDPEKYHIDHVVPFSRGGDHSTRNLRVIEKTKNLRKGGKMPGFGDFLKK